MDHREIRGGGACAGLISLSIRTGIWGFLKHVCDPASCIKCRERMDWPRNCWLLKKDSAAWSELMSCEHVSHTHTHARRLRSLYDRASLIQ